MTPDSAAQTEVVFGSSLEERLELLVDGAGEYALFLLDPNGVIMTWNVGAQRLFGYCAAEAIGQPLSVLYPVEAGAAGSLRCLEVAAAVGRAEDTGWRVRRDGSSYWASVLVTAVRDAQGGLRGFAKLVRDETGRRALERELHRAEHAADVDQLGVSLVDTVIRRIFGAGLELNASLQFITDPEGRRRVASALAQLDQAVQEVRSAAVGLHES